MVCGVHENPSGEGCSLRELRTQIQLVIKR
jgi:hypothetical protein